MAFFFLFHYNLFRNLSPFIQARHLLLEIGILDDLICMPRPFRSKHHQVASQNVLRHQTELHLIACCDCLDKRPHQAGVTAAMTATFKSGCVRPGLTRAEVRDSKGAHIANELAVTSVDVSASFANGLQGWTRQSPASMTGFLHSLW